ncbi:MAG: RNA polymerase sigma factor [Candidatus Gastranaerophilales bacterium]|nr:RNA polymerase sigma factor [Candidatus Gastranaerophilales bacterium]
MKEKSKSSSDEFETLFEQYFDRIDSYLLSLCHNEHLAEELTQETFFQILKSLPNYRGESSLFTWMCRIAKNVWYQYLRKEKKISKVSLEEGLPVTAKGTSIEDACVLQESKIRLYQNIRLLNEQMKEVMLMRLSGYLSFKEIGEIFGRSEAWARVTYHRARMILEEKENE